MLLRTSCCTHLDVVQRRGLLLRFAGVDMRGGARQNGGLSLIPVQQSRMDHLFNTPGLMIDARLKIISIVSLLEQCLVGTMIA